MLVDKQKYFKNHYHQKNLRHKKQFKSNIWSCAIPSCSAFNFAFVANRASFMFKPELFTRLEISDLLTNSFCYIFASTMSLANLL